MEETGRGTVGADGPRAVVEVPRALVAEEDLERIGGRALEVIGPVVFAVDDAEGAGDGVEVHGHVDEGGGAVHYGVMPLARRQLADKLKIPYAYFERMREKPFSLFHRC